MCWCDPSVKTFCCGKSDCFNKEGKSKIQIIKEQIKNLQLQLENEQSNCKHESVIYKYGSNTGNYDPHADCYWNDVKCVDCGKHFRFDNKEDELNYKLHGEIGSKSKFKKEDYDKFLEIQQQMVK